MKQLTTRCPHRPHFLPDRMENLPNVGEGSVAIILWDGTPVCGREVLGTETTTYILPPCYKLQEDLEFPSQVCDCVGAKE